MGSIHYNPEGCFANFDWDSLPKCEICDTQFFGDDYLIEDICIDCWNDSESPLRTTDFLNGET